jgi:hypothetical protein
MGLAIDSLDYHYGLHLFGDVAGTLVFFWRLLPFGLRLVLVLANRNWSGRLRPKVSRSPSGSQSRLKT